MADSNRRPTGFPHGALPAVDPIYAPLNLPHLCVPFNPPHHEGAEVTALSETELFFVLVDALAPHVLGGLVRLSAVKTEPLREVGEQVALSTGGNVVTAPTNSATLALHFEWILTPVLATPS